MRKQIIPATPEHSDTGDREWLNLDEIARVEVTSEDSAHPVEGALIRGPGAGWMAATPGEQTLRLLFDEPQTLKHVRLVFNENTHQRTQEFVLRCSIDGVTFRDIVRQQYHFNPPAIEIEEYDARLTGIKALELKIVPDITGGGAKVSLAELRLA